MDYLNPFSENFILLKLWDFLGSILDYLNPFSENFILLKLWDFLINIISYINPFSENFLGKKIVELLGDLLKFLFVPSDGYFDNQVNTIKSELYRILPYEDYINLFGTIKDLSTGTEISVGLNNYNLGNGLVYSNPNFIDFSWVTKYKDTWYGWVRGILFIFIIIYHLNQLLKLLRGVTFTDGSTVQGGTYFVSTNGNSLPGGSNKLLGGGGK